MRSRTTAEPMPGTEGATADAPLSSAREATKDFARRRRQSGRPALADVSVDIYRSEAFGIVGEIGSGKTTLGRLLIGFDTSTEGEGLFDGRAR